MNKRAQWTNGKRVKNGVWEYFEDSDEFIITLDMKDGITGKHKRFSVTGHPPEWGNWKLVPKKVSRGNGYRYNKRSARSESFASESDSDFYDACDGYHYDMGDR